ncbi:MAG: SLBB domain-containing protein [Paludibacter sp.]|nr:SLBB domain-containing protein [Paludibacter sp.]MDD4426892.1 SLBB domain-containing protein [Paludibacter sp.]
MKKYKLLLLLIVTFVGLHAQDFDKISPQQRMQLQQRVESGQNSSLQGKLSTQQNILGNKGGSMGSTPQQMSEFRKYINSINSTLPEDQDPYYIDDRFFIEDSLYRKFKKEEDKKKLRVFGSEIFDRSKVSFEPNLYLPTPANYIIGTNDELLVDVSGLYDVSYKLKVTPEGRIRIPNAGPVKVGGLTIENATKIVKNELSKYYSGIVSGETNVSLSLGNIRSIKIVVVGEATYPGTYTLPSLATVVNALYACGGPGKIGSMRNIRVVRNEKTVAVIDFYQFLMTGKLSNNIVLQDNDVIVIEPNKNKVVVDGAINRRGIYEVAQGESLYDLLNYAGGFRENANRSMVSVFRYSGAQRTVIDIPESYVATSLVKAGDSIYIAPVEDVYDNRVELSGAVFRPGGYALTPDLTIKSLIKKAGGLLDEAFVNMATIKRQRKNEIPEMISFNLGKVLNGENKDILLMKGDSVRVDSIMVFMEDQVVFIEGEVIKPGEYPLTMKMTVRDLIYQAKGFTEKASADNVQLIRIIKDPAKMEGGNKKSFNVSFKLDKDLNIDEGSGDMTLENGDLIIVRPIEGIEEIRIASIEGEVKNPGYYNIEHKNIKVSDLVKMSGGFTKFAFVGGAYLIRNENKGASKNSMSNILSRNLRRILQSSSDNNIDMAMLNKMQVSNVEELNALDSVAGLANVQEIQDLLHSEGVVSLNLNEIMKQPGSYKDIFVEDGDILYVPKKSQTVKVIGEVMYPSFVVHTSSYSFKDYITASGGFSNKALKKNAFVLYPNGKVTGTRSFLGIRVYPKVVSGSIVVIPKKPVELTNKMNPAEVITMTSSLASMTALIYSMLR